MKQIGLRTILIFSIICIYLLIFSMQALAEDDWQESDVLGYSDETSEILGFTTDSDGNIFVVYSINDPSPFPMAKMYDGITWTELGSGFIAEENGSQYIVRYDEMTKRLFVGLITINGVVHIYEFVDDEWEELTYVGRLLRIDPQYIYYDFQVMQDGSLVVAYVDIESEGRITAKVYQDGKWMPLGVPGFTEYTANYISLAVDHNNQYIYAGVIVQRSEVEVWRYSAEDGWEVTDSKSIESGYPYWVRLALGNGDRPILIYMDTELEWKTIGMIYDEGVWKYMEPYPFSPAMVRTFEMVMDSDGWPVVFFNDSEYENKITSMRYNGEAWENNGRRGFTQEGINTLFTGINKEDVPFVLFPDASEDGRILKMEYGELKTEDSISSDTDEVVSEESNEAVEESELTSTPQAPLDNIDDDSTSISIYAVIIPLLVVVIIIIVFLVMKKKKKDDEN